MALIVASDVQSVRMVARVMHSQARVYVHHSLPVLAATPRYSQLVMDQLHTSQKVRSIIQ